MGYSRTQNAYRITALAIVAAMALVALLASLFEDDISPLLALAIIVFTVGTAVIFTRLSVTIDVTSVTVAFGFGWPKRAIEIAEITSVHQVRNRWYHGWGIRLLTGGWMYNVWGLDAIELDLSSGRKFRIGTDDPEGLLAALTHLLST
ncbi:MAG: hypothetical protein BMS9Abin17_0170 [Acidimicrobiia bacterium]|nr:MAG: hypothetical protein BMS9Abin17_0170 [Acidimicrobiia bacterium]